MKRVIIAIACALTAPLVIAQTTTTVTRETTVQEVMRLDSTHVLTVKGVAPGETISVQTAPETNPITIRLDHAVAYVNGDGKPIDPSSINPGSKVRLEFTGPGSDRMVTRVIMINPR